MGSMKEQTAFGHPMREHFLFDKDWVNMNHGSFGTYPRQVQETLRAHRDSAEAAPDRFMKYEYVGLLKQAREECARIINASVDECVMILNATTAVNVVLRNLTWEDKDTIIYFDTIYPACNTTLLSLQETFPQIHLRKVGGTDNTSYTLPCSHTDIVNAFSQTISRLLYEGYKPKVALFDTIVSVPGVRFPFERLTKICKEYGILSLIDGAHGIGQIPLNMRQLDPDFFVSNCHKWLYTPRGSAVFFVPSRNHHLLRTSLPTSIGYQPRTKDHGVKRLLLATGGPSLPSLFQYVGSADNCPYYCVPAARKFREQVCGGEEAIYEYMRDIAQHGGDVMAEILGTRVMDDLQPAERTQALERLQHNPDSTGQRSGWNGGIRDCAMVNVLLPIKIVEKDTHDTSVEPTHIVVKRANLDQIMDWMLDTLVFEFHTNIQIFEYDQKLWTRASGQIYLELQDFEWTAKVLQQLCDRVQRGEASKANSDSDGPKQTSQSTADMEALGIEVSHLAVPLEST